MYGFKAFVFKGKKTAAKALDALEHHSPNTVSVRPEPQQTAKAAA